MRAHDEELLMRITHYQWLVVFLTALLGLASFAVSAEPVAGENSALPSDRAGQEARGLLAKRFSTPAPTAVSNAILNEEPTDRADQRALAPTGWITMVNGSASASGPQTQTGYDSLTTCMNISDHCDSGDCCPDPLWCHRCGVFADFLYLRPGNIDYIYAVEQTGTLPTDSPTGPVGRVGFDGAPGYRFGFNYALSDCSSIQASYTWFQDGTGSTINATPGTVLIFQPGLPSIPNVGASSIQTSARYDIRFQQIDLDYRGLLYGTCNSQVNYFAGLRYANLDQRFSAQENIGVPIGLSAVRSEINFDGFGIGFGLDGMRRSENSGLLIYGRASSSFVSGEFKADFRQTAQFGPTAALGNTLVDYRVMTILQSELGLGWQDQCGRIRVTVGYMFAGWFNALTTGSYIPGVQARQFNDLNETITFDGLVTRVLWQF
jgi:major outer membrane protein